jgi:hypothetical protein
MRPHPRSFRPHDCPCPWPVFLSLVLLAAAGCEEPRHVGGARSSSPTAPSAADNAPPPEPPKPVSHGEILGKRTQDIRKAEPELEKGAVAASTKITAKDPITIVGNAYVTSVGRTALGNITHAIDLYHAENGRYPANYDEFMTEIIKKNNIALPVLPAYQEYGYDEKEHKLILLEYPDRKARAHPGER